MTYRHRHIDIDIEVQEMKERRFYVPETFETKLKKMEDILRREGSNLSRWIREQIEDYVRRHEPGNPQQTLTYLFEHNEPYRADVKCYCGDVAVAKVWAKNGWVGWLCEKHYIQSREARLLKKWKKL